MSGDCTPGQPVPLSPDIHDADWSDDEAAAAGVCYNGKIFYLASASAFATDTEGDGGQATWVLRPLPGANRKTLTGDREVWGGLTMEDFVISSYEGYLANGNKNGYKPPDDGQHVGGPTTDLPFENGVRTPGFISVPICFMDDMACLTDNPNGNCINIGTEEPDDNPYFPCSNTK